MVVTPEYVKVHCCNNYSTSSTGERGSSIYSGMLPQQQHLHHWVQTRGLHLEINFRPTIPHCSQARHKCLAQSSSVHCIPHNAAHMAATAAIRATTSNVAAAPPGAVTTAKTCAKRVVCCCCFSLQTFVLKCCCRCACCPADTAAVLLMLL